MRRLPKAARRARRRPSQSPPLSKSFQSTAGTAALLGQTSPLLLHIRSHRLWLGFFSGALKLLLKILGLFLEVLKLRPDVFEFLRLRLLRLKRRHGFLRGFGDGIPVRPVADSERPEHRQRFRIAQRAETLRGGGAHFFALVVQKAHEESAHGLAVFFIAGEKREGIHHLAERIAGEIQRDARTGIQGDTQWDVRNERG